MRSRKQFAIRLVVALGIAFVGMGAIGTVIAFSAVERRLDGRRRSHHKAVPTSGS
jgi:hypothetical protein